MANDVPSVLICKECGRTPYFNEGFVWVESRETESGPIVSQGHLCTDCWRKYLIERPAVTCTDNEHEHLKTNLADAIQTLEQIGTGFGCA
jgi:hypothetical protein